MSVVTGMALANILGMSRMGTNWRDAYISPYNAPGIIVLDAYTAYSDRINVIVLEEEPVKLK